MGQHCTVHGKSTHSQSLQLSYFNGLKYRQHFGCYNSYYSFYFNILLRKHTNKSNCDLTELYDCKVHTHICITSPAPVQSLPKVQNYTVLKHGVPPYIPFSIHCLHDILLIHQPGSHCLHRLWYWCSEPQVYIELKLLNILQICVHSCLSVNPSTE